ICPSILRAIVKRSLLWPENQAPYDPAIAQLAECGICFGERAFGIGDGPDAAVLDEGYELARFGKRSHIGAKDGELAQREHQYRQAEATAHKTDDDDGAALPGDALGKGERQFRADEIDAGVGGADA